MFMPFNDKLNRITDTNMTDSCFRFKGGIELNIGWSQLCFR